MNSVVEYRPSEFFDLEVGQNIDITSSDIESDTIVEQPETVDKSVKKDAKSVKPRKNAKKKVRFSKKYESSSNPSIRVKSSSQQLGRLVTRNSSEGKKGTSLVIGRNKNGGVKPSHSSGRKGINALKCSYCQKKFKFHSQVRKHENTHTGGEIHQYYECRQCHAKFNGIGNLTRHKKMVHGTDVPHECLQCGEKFSVVRLLRMHQRLHTSETPASTTRNKKRLQSSKGMENKKKDGKNAKSQPLEKKRNSEAKNAKSQSLQNPNRKKQLFTLQHYKHFTAAKSPEPITSLQQKEADACTFLCNMLQRKKPQESSLTKTQPSTSQADEITPLPPLQEETGKLSREKPAELPPTSQQTEPPSRPQRTKATKKHSGCVYCKRKFPSSLQLKRHEMSCRYTTSRCNQCSKVFGSFGSMLRHRRTVHSGEKPYLCDKCGKAFSLAFSLKLHEGTHSTDRFFCDSCKKSFKNPGSFKRHVVVKHEGGGRQYPCSLCKKTFTQRGSVMRHVHVAHHPDDKPHECPDCGKKFSLAQTLKCHLRVHTGETPYSCATCRQEFVHYNQLKVHNVKQHARKMDHSCRYCDKPFPTKTQLNIHVRSHTGEKSSHPCEVCKKSFFDGSTLARHKMIHSGKKPYTCDQCDFSSYQLSNLQVHARQHTGERPYVCKDCKATFVQNHHLKKHRRTMH